MRKHVQILGVLNIVWGSFAVLAALIVMLIFGGAIGLIGLAGHRDPDAIIAIPIVGLVGGIIFVLIMLTALPAIAAGYGLLRLLPWARIFGIVISAIHVFAFPFGTVLGIYGLWVLFSDETVRLFAPYQGPPPL